MEINSQDEQKQDSQEFQNCENEDFEIFEYAKEDKILLQHDQ